MMCKDRLCFLFVLVLSSICLNLQENQAQEKLIPFEKEDKWGYMDEQGNTVIKPQFIIAELFPLEGIAAVVDDSGWAYIDKRGIMRNTTDFD